MSLYTLALCGKRRSRPRLSSRSIALPACSLTPCNHDDTGVSQVLVATGPNAHGGHSSSTWDRSAVTPQARDSFTSSSMISWHEPLNSTDFAHAVPTAPTPMIPTFMLILCLHQVWFLTFANFHSILAILPS